jgi:hypothetical protein
MGAGRPSAFGREQRVLKADAAKAPEQMGLVQQEAA